MMNIIKKIQNKIILLVRSQTIRFIPNYIRADQNRNDRSGALYKAWGHIISNNIEGAYYEFGVYKGDCLSESLRIYNDYYNWILSQKNSDEEWRKKIQWYVDHQFYAFDTYEGMPKNDEGHHAFQEGSFVGTLDEVKKRINSLKHSKRVSYLKGEFSKVHREQPQEIENLDKVAIANIDCDLYQSTKDALEIIKDKLQQGTVLLMDDWDHFCADNSKGQRKALKEFLEKNNHIYLEDYIIYSFVGKAFIVHFNDQSI